MPKAIEKKIRNSILLLLIIGLFSCSDNKVRSRTCEVIPEINKRKDIEKYICINEYGITIEAGYMLYDSLYIDEQYIYYSSGEIKEYRFFNPSGELRFRRQYDEDGGLLKEEGDFFAYLKFSSLKIELGDTVVFNLHIAKPPHCEFEVFGVYRGERYNTNNLSDIPFVSKHVIEPDKVGMEVFVFEIDFIDHVNNTKETRKSDIVFEVIDSN